LLATVGLANHVVVETPDAVMIAPMDRVQDVKELVSALKKSKRSETAAHRRVTRAWGSFDRLQVTEGFQILHLTVNPGGSLSLNVAPQRQEQWVVVAGAIAIEGHGTIGQGQSVSLSSGQTYSIENSTRTPAEIVAVGIGEYAQGNSYLDA
jgi:mannose-1-phosphate guanylyltransferase / mannose-6-phosphate isomerase